MKKIVVWFLCGFILLGFISCKSNSGNFTTEKEATIIKITDEVKSDQFSEYNNILELCRLIVESKFEKIDNESIANEVLYHSLYQTINNASTSYIKAKQILGYTITDINNDGILELIFLTNDYVILSIFTFCNDNPKLLDTFGTYNNYCFIDSDGFIYKSSYGKGDNWVEQIFTITSDGKLSPIVIYGCLDENIDDIEVEYYKIINNQRITIQKEEATELSNLYSTRNIQTLNFIPLFESNTPILESVEMAAYRAVLKNEVQLFDVEPVHIKMASNNIAKMITPM